MQHNKRWPFRGLSWRLAISYFLVTLLAALTIEATFVIGPIVKGSGEADDGRSLMQIMQERNGQIAAYLQSTKDPDQAVIHSQFVIPLLIDLQRHVKSGQYGAVAMLDDQQQVLDSDFITLLANPKLAQPVAAGLDAGAVPDISAELATRSSQSAILSALAANPDLRLLRSKGTDGYTTLAMPIEVAPLHTLGVLVVLFQGDETDNATPELNLGQAFLAQIQPAAIYFLILATVVGTVTGLIISRNLSRRLSQMAQAANAWSQGEFDVVITDRSRDELGELGNNLNRMAEQLHSLLTARQHMAVLEERNRLARELHDSVKQHVFANALLVRAARKTFSRDPEKAQASLLEAEWLAQQTQEELVALIHALRPATLANKGLVAAVQEFAEDWSRRMGITVEVRTQGERLTPLDIEEALFRVTQESLTNVARHSDAHHAEIQMSWSTEAITLIIHDDGKGFDVKQAARTGTGLRNMRERLAASGGTLIVTSSPEGTTVDVLIPLIPLIPGQNDSVIEVPDA